jgi:geranylgeranyl pyrophosphate synthase
MSYQDILGEINGDLAYVEKELHRHARSSPTLLGESSECLVQAGGKRLRPAFVLLSGIVMTPCLRSLPTGLPQTFSEPIKSRISSVI